MESRKDRLIPRGDSCVDLFTHVSDSLSAREIQVAAKLIDAHLVTTSACIREKL